MWCGRKFFQPFLSNIRLFSYKFFNVCHYYFTYSGLICGFAADGHAEPRSDQHLVVKKWPESFLLPLFLKIHLSFCFPLLTTPIVWSFSFCFVIFNTKMLKFYPTCAVHVTLTSQGSVLPDWWHTVPFTLNRIILETIKRACPLIKSRVSSIVASVKKDGRCCCHFVYGRWAAISVCMLPPVTFCLCITASPKLFLTLGCWFSFGCSRRLNELTRMKDLRRMLFLTQPVLKPSGLEDSSHKLLNFIFVFTSYNFFYSSKLKFTPNSFSLVSMNLGWLKRPLFGCEQLNKYS